MTHPLVTQCASTSTAAAVPLQGAPISLKTILTKCGCLLFQRAVNCASVYTGCCCCLVLFQIQRDTNLAIVWLLWHTTVFALVLHMLRQPLLFYSAMLKTQVVISPWLQSPKEPTAVRRIMHLRVINTEWTKGAALSIFAALQPQGTMKSMHDAHWQA